MTITNWPFSYGLHNNNKDLIAGLFALFFFQSWIYSLHPIIHILTIFHIWSLHCVFNQPPCLLPPHLYLMLTYLGCQYISKRVFTGQYRLSSVYMPTSPYYSIFSFSPCTTSSISKVISYFLETINFTPPIISFLSPENYYLNKFHFLYIICFEGSLAKLAYRLPWYTYRITATET